MTLRPCDDNSVIVGDHARFQMLTPSLVRMEYSPSGQFEDRVSVRAIARPEPIAFDDIQLTTDHLRLDTGEMIIEYRDDGESFHRENVAALDRRTGRYFWDPSSVDGENLGSVHFSMDCIKPGMTQAGVHPATFDHHRNVSEWSLWTFHGRLHSEESEAVGDAFSQAQLFDEVLATVPFRKLPPALQELVAERRKFPPGLLSKAGYFLYNDSQTPALDPETNWVLERDAPEGTLDAYLFFYRRDFAQALRDYRLLFGAAPLLPRYCLGLWYSRYPTFNQAELEELVGEFERRDLPLDMLVLDLEWHQRGWHGWDWNTQHIPDPDKLLDVLRKRHIHTTFNTHPTRVPVDDSRFDEFLDAAGIECNKDDIEPDFRGTRTFGDFDVSNRRHAEAFMDVLHKPVQDQGVDFWWIDGESPVSEIDNLDSQFWTNHIYHEHIKQNYPDRRPMIFSRTPGFGAHRYPLHFTGDTWSYWETLENQVEQTLRAGHIGQSFVTHDIGGHISSYIMIDPELYVRWVGFAALNPIVRLHSSKIAEGIGGERRPWLYGAGVLASFRNIMRLRMQMIPYLYTLAWQSASEGLPMCRSNCIQFPDWQEGYDVWDAYCLGDRIYAAPVVNPGTLRKVLLPPGVWYHALTGERIESDGTTWRTEVSPLSKPPLHYYRGGSLMIKQPYAQKASVIPNSLIVEAYCSTEPATDRFVLYEDDGFSQYHKDGKFTQQTFEMRETENALYIDIHPALGNYEGAPGERAFEFRVIGATSARCEVDGDTVSPRASETGSRPQDANAPPNRRDEGKRNPE